MARPPKYGRPTEPFSFRPRPANGDAIKKIVEHTGGTVSELTDEIVTLGLPVLLRKRPELKEVVQPA